MTLVAACERFITADEVTCDCDALSASELNEMIDSVSNALAILTRGNVTGRCTDTVRPRREGAAVCGCVDAMSCRCGPISGIPLRGPNPVITSVTLDGAAFTDFIVVDERILVRTDGRGWPGCQDITLASTEVGTLEIEYTYGAEIDYMAKAAASEILCSFIARPPQNQQKSLPNNTRFTNFSGVSITMETLIEEVNRRSFMLPAVNRFLNTFGGSGVVLWSPELEENWRLHTRT